MVLSIRVSRVGRVRVSITVTVRVSRVSVMVSVRIALNKNHCEYGTSFSRIA